MAYKKFRSSSITRKKQKITRTSKVKTADSDYPDELDSMHDHKHEWVPSTEGEGNPRQHVCRKCKSIRTKEFDTYYYWYPNDPFNWYDKEPVPQSEKDSRRMSRKQKTAIADADVTLLQTTMSSLNKAKTPDEAVSLLRDISDAALGIKEELQQQKTSMYRTSSRSRKLRETGGYKSKKSLFTWLKEQNAPTRGFTTETFGRDSMIYIAWSDMDTKYLWESKLQDAGFKVNPKYCAPTRDSYSRINLKGCSRTEVQVSYFKGRHWDE